MGGVVARAAFMPPEPFESEASADCIWLTTSLRHRIPAYYHSGGENARYTILFSHGNAEDISHLYQFLQVTAKEIQANIFSYDYAGYSWSHPEGHPERRITPREHTAFADVEAAYRYLLDELHLDPERELVFWGRSLGTGPTCYIAARHQSAGVILQSPLQSAVRVAFNPHCTLPFDIFANIGRAPRITQPALVMHGTEDRVIHVEHGRRVFASLASERKQLWLVEGAGHNDIEFRFEYVARLVSFLRSLGDEEEVLDHEADREDDQSTRNTTRKETKRKKQHTPSSSGPNEGVVDQPLHDEVEQIEVIREESE